MRSSSTAELSRPYLARCLGFILLFVVCLLFILSPDLCRRKAWLARWGDRQGGMGSRVRWLAGSGGGQGGRVGRVVGAGWIFEVKNVLE